MSDDPRDNDPNKTAPIADPTAGDVNAPSSVEDAERKLQEAAKSGTNLDTLVGRLVVEQGLATSDEVKHCLELRRQSDEDESNRSLMALLVERDYVTKRQLTRLREILEAERQGQKIPGYKILGELGAGAMAKVYKAKQLSLNREVAIKILPKKYSQNAQFIERFYAEGRAAAQLNHPNIVQAFDVGNTGDTYFFVMEYVAGRTVHDDIQEHKRYPEKEAVNIIIQVAEALEHAHAKGLIHRDVKPKNVMITREGVVKLADMGLARAVTDLEAAEAEKGKAFGTPYYISPEQIRGEMNIGPPADIYSLGATLYHMVTGSVPYEGKNPSAVMHKHLKGELVPPDHVNPKLSPGISEVIEMMMARSSRKRYQTATDLLVDLRALKKGEQPPIAHKEVLAADDLASLAAAEAAAQSEGIPEDATEGSGRAISDILLSPPYMILMALLVISVILNIFLALYSR